MKENPGNMYTTGTSHSHLGSRTRKNLTSKWSDVYELLATRAASALDEDSSTIWHEALLEDLLSFGRSATVQFAVVVGEDSRMQLQLQSLPGSANTLSEKPLLRG